MFCNLTFIPRWRNLINLEKWPIYLLLPSTGEVIIRFAKKIYQIMKSWYFLRIHGCWFPPTLRSVCKDVLSPLYVTSVILVYVHICRTIQSLETRIDQNVPAKFLHRRFNNLHKLVNISGSVINEHLNNPVCARQHTSIQYLLLFTYISSSMNTRGYFELLEATAVETITPVAFCYLKCILKSSRIFYGEMA